jgi:hypothetical protein
MSGNILRPKMHKIGRQERIPSVSTRHEAAGSPNQEEYPVHKEKASETVPLHHHLQKGKEEELLMPLFLSF